MTQDYSFDFEYELAGKKLIVVSLKINSRNHFKEYFERLEPRAQKRFLAITRQMAGHLGFDVQDSRKFEWLHGFDNLGQIKIHNPGHRIYLTRFFQYGNFMILLMGGPKRSKESKKTVREQYRRADQFIKIIRENEDELRKKLARLYRGSF